MFSDEGISVSEFIGLINQTFELAYPIVKIVGELANFRVSKNKWLYFDLKDNLSSLKFFGTVYNLKGPLEDGMMLRVTAAPKLHNQYGFSMNVMEIEPVGEGSLKKAAELLQAKLAGEGLFDEAKKRLLPYPPTKIGLITSAQSAAYHDFIKIINNRWRGLEISLIDVQVQGEAAISQIVSALADLNQQHSEMEAVVLIRGGGSPEDLAAFSSEQVTRAVAASKIPTLVAIGHEIDVSLAELAADKRASTPSNAAEVLVPERKVVLSNLRQTKKYLSHRVEQAINLLGSELAQKLSQLYRLSAKRLDEATDRLKFQSQLVEAYNPSLVLKRGYAIVRKDGQVLRTTTGLWLNDILNVTLAKGSLKAAVKSTEEGEK